MSIIGDVYRKGQQGERCRVIILRGVCSYHLKVLIMEHFDLTYGEVNAAFSRFSDGFWESDAMDRPDGWRGVAELVAMNCGSEAAGSRLPVTLH